MNFEWKNFFTGLAIKIGSIIAGSMGAAVKSVISMVTSGYGALKKYNQEGVALARQMGINANEAQAYTTTMITRAEKLCKVYGIAAEQVMELQKNITNATSKQYMLNDAEAETMVQINKIVGSNIFDQFTTEMMNGMGAQLNTVQGAVSKAYATAAKSGLNAQKMSEKIASNLSMANRLSFRNGINGLTRMAMQAEKVGMNLQSVESAAMKFMDLEQAIQNSAQMQMLGGSAAAMFGNPLTAMYEANYDPESFAKRMQDSLASYATFDAKSGISNINGMNMDFVRQIAGALGIGVDEASKMAKKQSEVRYKKGAFGAALGNYSQEQQDFILNKSFVKDGRLKINDINGQEHDISNGMLPKKILDEMMKFNGKSDRDIMESQALTLTSIEEQIKGFKDSFDATLANALNRYVPDLKKVIDYIGKIATSKVAPAIAKGIITIGDYLKAHGPAIKNAADLIVKWAGNIYHFFVDYWHWIAPIGGAVLAYIGLRKATQFAYGMADMGKNFKWNPFARPTGGPARAANAATNTVSRSGGFWQGIRNFFGRNGSAAASNATKGGGILKGIKGFGGKFISSVGYLGKSAAKSVKNSSVGSYVKYVKGNYTELRQSGKGVFSSLRNATKAPKVLSNGTIMGRFNGNVGKFMGKVGSNTAKSNFAKSVMKGGKLLKLGGAATAAFAAIEGATSLINYKNTKRDLNKALERGEISKQEYEDQVNEARINKNAGIGGAVGSAIGASLGTFLGPLGTIAGGFLGEKIGSFIGKNWDAVTEIASDAWNGIKGFAKGAWDTTKDLAKGAWKIASGALSKVGNMAKGAVNTAIEIGSTAFKTLREVGTEYWHTLTNIGSEAWNSVLTAANGVWDGISNVAHNVWDGILTNANSAISGIGNVANSIKESVISAISSGYDAAKSVYHDIKSEAKSLYKDAKGEAKAFHDTVKGDVKGLLNYGLEFAKIIYGSKNNSGNMVNGMPTVTPKQPMVTTKPVGEKEYIYIPNKTETSNVNGNTVTVKDFNVNISGTIKLDGGNNSKNVDINELLNDRQFVNKLKDMIKDSINVDIHGGRYGNSWELVRGHLPR